MRGLAVVVGSLLAGGALAHAQPLMEGFDSGVPAGWTVINNSSTVGSTSWFRPVIAEQPFSAHLGSALNDYLAANFNSVDPPSGSNGTISTWLLTPQLTWTSGDILRFYSRTVDAPVLFPDRLEVRYSTAGASTNVGANHTQVGDFTTLLTTINPTLTTTGYPSAWTNYTLQMPSAGSGRIAFRYYVTDAGPTAPNGDYIGLDTVSFMADLLGDLNGDGFVNNQDIAPFVLLLTDPAGFAVQYPFIAGNILGDINGDSVVNNQDIAPFVALLTGARGVPDADPQFAPLLALVPEPASLSLLALGALAALRRRR